MSTYWGYRCQDCSQDTEHWLNHGEMALSEFFLAHQLMHAYEFGWVEISILGSASYLDEMRSFLDTHEGHDIVLANEYGETKPVESVTKRKIGTGAKHEST